MVKSKSSSRSSSSTSRSSASSAKIICVKSAYSAMQLSDVRMSLHTEQQSLILSEMSIARKKLEEDNQRLRDDLEEARLLIRLLQVKLNQAEHKKQSIIRVKAVGSGDSTVKGGVPAGYWNALDKAAKGTSTRKSSFFFRNKKELTRKEAFRNPTLSGKRTFLSKNKVKSKMIPVEEVKDTTPKMIVFPMQQHTEKKSEKPQRSKRDPEEQRGKSSTMKKSQLLKMMAASTQQERQDDILHEPAVKQDTTYESPEYHDVNGDEEEKQALCYSIMDELELKVSATPVIPEEDEYSAEEEEDCYEAAIISTPFMTQMANLVIKEYSCTTTDSADLADLYMD